MKDKPATLNCSNLAKTFGDVAALTNISFTIPNSQYVCIIGASGAGKTTLLRILAGLETPTSGEVSLQGQNILELPAKERNVAMVFQNYALFPHLNVYENIAIGQKIRKVPKDDIYREVKEVSSLLNISHLLQRKPRHISGGEQQRVALGRAIMRNPSLFLLDEPLANMDPEIKLSMRTELKKLQRNLEKLFIHVTHNQFEAMSIADNILILDKGRIIDIGTPEELYFMPNNIPSANFFGFPKMNFVDVILKRNTGYIECFADKFTIRIHNAQLNEILLGLVDKEVTLGFRPESLSLHKGDGLLPLCRGEIINRELYGSFVIYHIKRGDTLLNLIDKQSAAYNPGDIVDVFVNSAEFHYFDKKTQQNCGIQVPRTNTGKRI